MYTSDYQQHKLVASIDVEDKPQLNLALSVTLLLCRAVRFYEH